MEDDPLLIVDDDEALRSTLSDYLTDHGYRTLQAAGGKAALTIIEARINKHGTPKLKLILSDWMMPDGDGISLLNHVRNSHFKHIPFILMSGAVSKQELIAAAQFDPDGIMLKPFPPSSLLDKLKEAIHNRTKKKLSVKG